MSGRGTKGGTKGGAVASAGHRIRIRKPRPRTPQPPLDLRTPSGRRLPY
ncbi:hypothetical protein GCM10010106_20870 [Thermopolyspora flexuosa]|uniref:Uncharacterized protein n=1 Tax=Thermopolyspora flexuosa TaxID=103836 RepID=A0A543J3E2_9ACTN|nr:hypothetical protein [Thermopolyspora flexuosa]TQM77332.1 hypothetical protein FHX40_4094 [Thermopolyspora flexuosa]GGM74141.1 hypothetical protein GCM10010106_20870 [Thermopolyspora flexuosa]